MTKLRTAFLILWPLSLVVFAAVLWLHLPLVVPGVPGGIGDHQAAGDAATVDAIHAAWLKAGVYGQAHTAMIGDLAWIWLYALGSVLGGLYLRKTGGRMSRAIGVAVILAGLVFLLADYTETICQFIQLRADSGADDLAVLAANVRPPKIVAWIVTFVGILAGFVVRRLEGEGGRSAARSA